MYSRFAAATLALTLATGCLPYTVGSTAQTIPAGESTKSAHVYYIPDAIDLSGDSVSSPMRGSDLEMRFGVDDRSDIGFRIPSYSGAVFTYKRRLVGTSAPESPAVSLMTGGGFVNWGEHAEGELTLMASGSASGIVTPYGGLRAMQVFTPNQKRQGGLDLSISAPDNTIVLAARTVRKDKRTGSRCYPVIKIQ